MREAPKPRMRSHVVDIVSGLYGYLILVSSQKKPRSKGTAEINRYNTGKPTEKKFCEQHQSALRVGCYTLTIPKYMDLLIISCDTIKISPC